MAYKINVKYEWFWFMIAIDNAIDNWLMASFIWWLCMTEMKATFPRKTPFRYMDPDEPWLSVGWFVRDYRVYPIILLCFSFSVRNEINHTMN